MQTRPPPGRAGSAPPTPTLTVTGTTVPTKRNDVSSIERRSLSAICAAPGAPTSGRMIANSSP
ncbi:MAG: hypothetical protein ACK5U8_20555, partial [Deltaproteobacteria bacterium]